MEKKAVIKEAFTFLGTFNKQIKTKLTNICGKTGQYSVPKELFQKRTSRKNRVLISWKAVRDNNLTIDQLHSFSGGVAVEFLNNDFFDTANKKDPVFEELCNRIGSDEQVSSIISIRTEAGSSSSAIPRDAFRKLINNTTVKYKNNEVTITSENYRNYAISQIEEGGTGNEKWDGFLFVSIKGGQQDTIETHRDQELTIFNPACEFANEDICCDIDLTMAYFAMLSVNKKKLDPFKQLEYENVIKDLEASLKTCHYLYKNTEENLFDYVKFHPSVALINGQLTDPIQLKRIDIMNFAIETRAPDSVDFTHNEAVVDEKYYWDSQKKCILSPSRPTNIFWSFHLSNMMQQDFNLEEYFEQEKQRYERRQELLETSNGKTTSKN